MSRHLHGWIGRVITNKEFFKTSLIYQKNVKHANENDIDSTYGEIRHFKADLMNSLKFTQIGQLLWTVATYLPKKG